MTTEHTDEFRLMEYDPIHKIQISQLYSMTVGEYD